MFRFFTRRLAFMMLTLFIVSMVIFAVTELLPGDVAVMILGSEATDETLAALRTKLGLDRPAAARYVDWLSGAARGDFGESLRMRTEVGPLVLERLKNSVALAGIALVIGVPLAITAAMLSFRATLRHYAPKAASETERVRCPGCGETVPRSAEHCPLCGRGLSEKN